MNLRLFGLIFLPSMMQNTAIFFSTRSTAATEIRQIFFPMRAVHIMMSSITKAISLSKYLAISNCSKKRVNPMTQTKNRPDDHCDLWPVSYFLFIRIKNRYIKSNCSLVARSNIAIILSFKNSTSIPAQPLFPYFQKNLQKFMKCEQCFSFQKMVYWMCTCEAVSIF